MPTRWPGDSTSPLPPTCDIDLLGEVVGGGTYESLAGDADSISLFGLACWVLRLDRLIEVKRAAGRPKDLEVIAELEALRDEAP